MTRVRCPRERCIFWMDGWCDIDEIELSPVTLACITFEEMDTEVAVIGSVEGDDLEWDEDESLFDDDLDESLYGYDDEEEDEDEELVADEGDDWSK